MSDTTTTYRPNPTVGSYRTHDFDGALRERSEWSWSGTHSGDEDRTIAELVRSLERHGHATTEGSIASRPSNHHIIGLGVGHDDAEFAEVGRSMAAYYENGDALDGRRWWDEVPYGARRYYEVAR